MPPTYLEELYIAIKADLSSLQTGLTAAAHNVRGFGGKVAAASGQLQKFGKTVTIVSGAVAALGGLAVKVFAQFEQSMANTFSVLGAGQEEMQKLTQFAREMGGTTVFTASQAADAMYFLASAGFDTNKIMGSLQGTLDLAAATQFDLAETTRIVVSALNSYNLTAEDSIRVANTFSAIIGASQATMDRLGDSFKFVAPIMSNLGINLEQTAAALGILYNSGLQASQAGTYLRQGMLSLQAPTAGAEKALAELGISLGDVNPQANDLVEILTAFKNAGADAKDAGDELADIFGKRAVTAFQILIREGGDALGMLEEKITGTNKASEMAETQLDTLSGSMRLLLSASQEMAIAIGETVVPVIRGLADGITSLVRMFNEIPEAIKTLLISIPALGVALGLIVGPTSLLLAQLPKLIAFFKGAGGVLSGFGGTIALAAIAIGALTVGLGYLLTKQEREQKALMNNIGALEDYNDQRIKEKQGAYDLLTSYQELAKKKNKTNEESQKLEKVEKKLLDQYPDLIDATQSYGEKAEAVETKIYNLGIELDSLYGKQKQLTMLKLNIDISNIESSISDLKEDFSNISWWENIWADMSGAPLNLTKTFDTLKDAELEAFGVLEKSMDVALDNTKTMTVNTKDFSNNLLKGFQDGSISLEKLNKDVGSLRELYQQVNFEAVELEASQMAAERNGEEINSQEKNKLSTLKLQRDQIKSIINAYASAGGQIANLVKNQDSLEQKQKTLNELEKENAEDKKKKKVIQDEIVESTNKEKELSEEELAILKQRIALAEKLKNQILQEQLNALQLRKDATLESAIETAHEEYKIKQEMLENQKKIAIRSAEEIGANTEAINELFNQKRLNLDSQYYQERKQIYNEYTDQWMSDQERRLEFEANQNIEGLERYREFLANKLLLENEFSEEWLSIRERLLNVEEQLFERQYGYLADIADLTARSVGRGWERMWSDVVETGEISKLRIENFFDELVLSFGRMLNRMVADLIRSGILKLLSGLINTIMPGAGSALNAVTDNSIIGNFDPSSYSDYADTGALVKRGGTLNVKPNEVVVPAEITRGRRDQYQNAMDKATGSSQVTTNNNNFSMTLSNPVVDDEAYWQKVLEDYVIPNLEKINKRQS